MFPEKLTLQKLLIILFVSLGITDLTRAQSAADSGTIRSVRDTSRKATGVFVGWSDTIPESANVNDFLVRNVCKGYRVTYMVFREEERCHLPFATEEVKAPAPMVAGNRAPLLRASGNILYEVDYRSRIDTPYAEDNVYQHTLQTRLDLVYKDQYPFRIYLTTRFSNSSLFKKYIAPNVQFSQADFKRMVKAKAYAAMESYLNSKMRKLDSLKGVIDEMKSIIAPLKQSLQKPDISQKLVEEREKEFFKNVGGQPYLIGSLDTGSAFGRFTYPNKFKFKESSKFARDSGKVMVTRATGETIMKYKAARESVDKEHKKLDSLVGELEKAEALYGRLKSTHLRDLRELRSQIEGTSDFNVLREKLQQLNIPDTLLPKGYKTLSAIQNLSVGRSTADYSEFSVKNISITGLQVEYNPRYYYALAIGKVDYRFRDYIIPDRSHSRQYVGLIRVGKGSVNGNHIFFTYYTGRRQFFNSSISSQQNTKIPEYNLAGVTVEGLYKISRNISIVAEIAKSTTPYYSLDSMGKKSWMNSITKFNDRSNEAYAVKLSSYFPKTLTRVTGNIRYIGANFQSFSTFTTGASQLRWMAKVEQPFFRKQLTLLSSLQQNDYNNPFVNAAYKSSSLLMSFQANLRVKNWPVVSVGYFPSYQLTKTGSDQYTECRYYTLSLSAGYYYRIKKAQASSFLVYSHFYNEDSDSGFVYFNSKNIMLSQNFMFNKLSLLFNASVSANTDYRMYSMESSAQLPITKYISAGAGVKMIEYSLIKSLRWGYSGNIMLKVPGLGDFQLMMDKGFIPGMNGRLTDNRTGRLTYFKTF